MKNNNSKTGMTLVELLIAVVLTAVAATMIYSGVFYSYKTVMRSRARLDAQGIAFDQLWFIYNQSLDTIMEYAQITEDNGGNPTCVQTPPNSVFSTNGIIQWSVLKETNPPILYVDYWTIWVQVWAPVADPLFSVMATNGTVTAAYNSPLAEYKVLRYRSDR